MNKGETEKRELKMQAVTYGQEVTNQMELRRPITKDREGEEEWEEDDEGGRIEGASPSQFACRYPHGISISLHSMPFILFPLLISTACIFQIKERYIFGR